MVETRCRNCDKLLMKDFAIKCQRCKTINPINLCYNVVVNVFDVDSVAEDIDWDNWQNKDGTYWDIKSVLHSKLEFLKENLRDLAASNDDEDEQLIESIDTINLVQKYISAFKLTNLEGEPV